MVCEVESEGGFPNFLGSSMGCGRGEIGGGRMIEGMERK